MASRWGSALWGQGEWATTYIVEGQGANFALSLVIQANRATFSLTGQPASLTVARSLGASAATYSVGGVAAALKVARVTLAGPASFAITDQPGSLTVSRVIAAGLGAVSIGGQDALLMSARSLVADGGTVVLSGQSAFLNYAHNGSFVLSAFPGGYAISGQDAGASFALRLVCDPGSVAITGSPAELDVHRAAVAQPTGGYEVITRKRVKQKERHEERAEIRHLLERAFADPALEAEALVEVAQPYMEPLSHRIDWTGLNAQMGALQSALDHYEAYLRAEDEAEDDDVALLLMAA